MRVRANRNPRHITAETLCKYAEGCKGQSAIFSVINSRPSKTSLARTWMLVIWVNPDGHNPVKTTGSADVRADYYAGFWPGRWRIGEAPQATPATVGPVANCDLTMRAPNLECY